MATSTMKVMVAAMLMAAVGADNSTNSSLAIGSATGPTPTTVAPTGPVLSQAQQEFLKDFAHKMLLLQIFLLLGYTIMCGLCVGLIVYLRYNRTVALKGDATAARKILLPAFEPLLWILGISTGIYAAVVAVTMALGTFNNNVTQVATEGFHCGRMFVFHTVIIYMMQKSVTVPALVRTVGISFVLAIYSLPAQIIISHYQVDTPAYKRMSNIVMPSVRWLILALYAYIFIWPPGRASKRTLREYVFFVFGYFACSITYTQLLYYNRLNEGFSMVYVTCIWAALAPLFIWRVLSADTQHWRGMGQRAVSLQSLFRQKHNLNERVSSQGLHVLIEMHRKLVIDFAYLELKQKIGMGSSAVVFNGVLHSKTPVAVKVYTPSEFDEDIVAEFSQEAALCGALNHPNIVKFYGMCVCPPTICLVSELCQGSLDDVTNAIANHHQHQHRQQQLINLTYMIDAARAVAYIHSFSPAFIHRDIKPSNFLVDANNTVKLTDFGESRSLPKSHVMNPPPGSNGGLSMSTSSSSFSQGKNLLMKSGATLRQQNGRQSSVVSHDTPAKLTVKGTVDYMAPEIIQGRAGVAQYGEAADVYSLAITMWDILNPGKEKFPTIRNNHLHIFESVVDGKRPSLDHIVHPTLREVITSAWHSDPRLRPSAQNIVSILETVQEECFAVFASDLSDDLDQEVTHNKYGELVAKTFTAQHAIDRMEELSFVMNHGEAVRLGNALMDAGLVHHVKHERPFEPGETQYFFDEDNINLCQPILAPGERGATDSDDDMDEDDVDPEEHVDHVVPLPTNVNGLTFIRSSVGRSRSRRGTRSLPRRKNSTTTSSGLTNGRTMTSAPSETVIYDNGMCPCRKLGQRLEQPKGGNGGKRRFRRHRQKAVSEENLLTAKLLGAEVMPLPMHMTVNGSHDFDDFESVNTHFEKHGDEEPGGLA